MRALLASLLLLAGAAQAETLTCDVFAVQDGDGLKVRCPDRPPMSPRILYADAPEVEHRSLHIKQQPWGKEAGDHLRELCLGKTAVVTTKWRMSYGRPLASVSCDGIDVATEQIRSGNAWASMAPKKSGLYTLEAQARAQRIGLWSLPDPVRPSLWRRMKASAQ